MFTPALMGRLGFRPGAPATLEPFEAGRHNLGLSAERDAVLIVPPDLQPSVPVPLLVMFHGGGGSADRVLPFVVPHALQRRFLLLAPQSTHPTWDLVIAGNGPDLERLDAALTAVAARYTIDPTHLCFAGFSDGASYALSIGITNGDVASHVIALSGGFMSVFTPEGSPRVFITHGTADEQLPVQRSGRAHATQLRNAGYDVQYVEFDGPHKIQPPIVAMAMDFFLGPAADASAAPTPDVAA